MKKAGLHIFFFIVAVVPLFGEARFPNEYKPLEFHDGGRVLCGKGDFSEYLFLVKPFWTLSPSLYYRENLKDSTWRSVALDHRRYINDAILTKDNIFLLWTDGATPYLGVLDLHTFFDISGKQENPIDVNRYLTITKIDEATNIESDYENQFFGVKSSKAIFSANGTLYKATISKSGINIEKIDENIAGAVVFETGKYDFAGIIDAGDDAYAYFYGDPQVEIAGAFDLGSENYFYPLDNKIAFLSGALEKSNYFYYQLIMPGSTPYPGIWINAKGACIKVIAEKSEQRIFFISGGKRGYLLERIDISAGVVTNREFCLLPENLFEAMALCIDSANVYAIFRNGMAVVSHDCRILASDYYSFGETINGKIQVSNNGKILSVNGSRASILFSFKENKLWMLQTIWESSGNYFLALFVLIVIFILYQRIRSLKHKLTTALDIPSLGIVFFIDRSGKLTDTNPAGKRFLNISDGSPLGKSFQYYCSDDSSRNVLEYVNQSFPEKETVSRKLAVTDSNGEARELSLKIIPLKNLAGNFKGFIVTAVDITEEIERKRLSYWAHLAHDMQTTIAAIKINAEELSLQSSDNLKKQSIIIRQAAILTQRVRDIVTVGRSDAITKELHDSESICNAVKMEFDWSRYPNIVFEIQSDKFKAACDKPVFIRAIRNAVENAIKAIKDKDGKIILSCRSELRYAFFSVKDNGPGLNEETKSKILKPYFTTSRKEGGSGIGTMIMQHALELHGGDISVESEKGKGTEVIFKIPNNLRDSKK